jgi:hypothetical protein
MPKFILYLKWLTFFLIAATAFLLVNTLIFNDDVSMRFNSQREFLIEK